jgi:hypothetical protein
MTMRTLCAALAGFGALLTAPLASADEFGDKGQLIFSADRLVPFLGYSQSKLTDNGTNPAAVTTVSSSQISLLWGSTSVSGDLGAAPGPSGATATTSAYTVPRLGFDYVLLPHLTVGGNVVFFTTVGSNSNFCADSANCVSQGNGTGDVVGIAPRAGYVLGLSGMLSLWLRGGFHYYHEHVAVPTGVCNSSNNYSAELGGLDLEPQLVISPISHFAFVAGPIFDWGFAGSYSTDAPAGPNNCNARVTASEGLASWNLSLNAGLIGWF